MRLTRSNAVEVLHEVYRRLYAAAEPKGNWDEMVESGEVLQEEFYLKYYLHEDEETEIISSYAKELKLNKRDTLKLINTVVLGSSPTSSRDVMLKARGVTV